MTAVADIASDVAPWCVDLEGLRQRFEAWASLVDEASSDAELIDRMQALVALRNSVDAAVVTTEFSFARVHTERMLAARADGVRADRTQHRRTDRPGQPGLAHRRSHPPAHRPGPARRADTGTGPTARPDG